jgi:hypothetical protein
VKFDGISRWYVAAYGDVAPGWRWLVRRGFRHCCAFGYCVALGRWVWVDAALTGMSVQIMDMDALVWRLTALRRLGCVILMGPDVDWRARGSGRKRGFWRLAPWCVAVTASVVGSNSRALRPHVFCRDLACDGWVPAFTGEAVNGGGICGAVCGGDAERCDGVVAGA